MTRVRPVVSRADRRAFLDLPYRLHRTDPHWIPPLRLAERDRLSSKKNPFFEHAAHELFLAERDGRVVGRIAAIDDARHNDVHHENIAAFGFFEAETRDDARALFEAVEAWAAARGRDAVRGPLNPSMNDQAGLLIDGFDTDPMVMMPHNPPEYGTFIEAAGYSKVKDLFAWLFDMRRPVPDVMVQLAERVKQRYQITVRPLALAEFSREVDRLREIYCGAWENNWGFVPPTEREFRHMANDLKQIFDPRGAVIAEVGGRPAACAIAIPDINQALKGTDGRLFPLGLYRLLRLKKYCTQARLLLLGVLSEFRSYRLYPLLVHQLHQQGQGAYQQVEFSWILEDNRDINQPAEAAGAVRYKTYRIYQKRVR